MNGVTLLPGMAFSQDWFTNNIPHLTELLAEYRGRDGVAFLEIGSFEGLSTVWFLQQVLTGTDSTITCIDTFLGSSENLDLGITRDTLRGTFERNVASFGGRVQVMEGESAVVLRTLSPHETFDMVYVDGAHEMANVLEDAVLSWPLLNTGGTMVFDDYLWDLAEDCPRPAIDAFLTVYGSRLEVLHKDYQVAVRKK